MEKVQAVSLNIYLLSRSCTSIVRLEDGIFPNRVCWNGPPFQRARISTRRQCVWKTLRANLVVVAGNTAVAEHKIPKKHVYLHSLHYVTIYPNRTPTRRPGYPVQRAGTKISDRQQSLLFVAVVTIRGNNKDRNKFFFNRINKPFQ